MSSPLLPLLARIGAMPPLKFVLLFAGLQALCTVALSLAIDSASPNAVAAAVWGLRAGVLLVFTVAAFHRDDDPLECGLLAAGVFLLGGGVAQAILASIAERTPMAAVVQLIFAPIGLVPAAIVLIPLCAALVWFARRTVRALRLPE